MTTAAPQDFAGAPTNGVGGSGSGALDDPANKTTTVVVNGGGNLSSFQPPAGQPNAYDDNDPFRIVEIGGMVLPGVLEPLDGLGTKEEWTQQKGTAGNFATSVWKGSKLSEGLKIKMRLPGRDSFAAIYKVRDILRPTRGKKPPSLNIKNAAINFGGITRVVVVDVGFPKWEASGGYWTYEIELNEYNPSANANTGAADPASTWNDPAKTTPGSAQKAEASAATGKATGA